jgi:hypothetical protein
MLDVGVDVGVGIWVLAIWFWFWLLAIWVAPFFFFDSRLLRLFVLGGANVSRSCLWQCQYKLMQYRLIFALWQYRLKIGS